MLPIATYQERKKDDERRIFYHKQSKAQVSGRRVLSRISQQLLLLFSLGVSLNVFHKIVEKPLSLSQFFYKLASIHDIYRYGAFVPNISLIYLLVSWSKQSYRRAYIFCTYSVFHQTFVDACKIRLYLLSQDILCMFSRIQCNREGF